LVYSICVHCREGKLLSEIDESLKKWEEGHHCSKEPLSVARQDTSARIG
jgi:hypothetical protein